MRPPLLSDAKTSERPLSRLITLAKRPTWCREPLWLLDKPCNSKTSSNPSQSRYQSARRSHSKREKTVEFLRLGSTIERTLERERPWRTAIPKPGTQQPAFLYLAKTP